jgi:methyltransferase family protein
MRRRSPLITVLRTVAAVLPGDYLKTVFYRSVIARPRAALRKALLEFYRFDHVYDVLGEVKETYKGSFSILEFGTHHGYAFTKMLYATEFLGMADRVTVHAFDTFKGLPPAVDRRDRSVITSQDVFHEGQFQGDYEALDALCRRRYRNYALHQGLFEDSLTPELLRTFETQLPILVWLDCDYYSSTRTVFERLIPYLPSGCVLYFDEIEGFNYGSRLTGEARAIYELNHGGFGEGIELVLDRRLSLEAERVYRFIRLEGGPTYERAVPMNYNPGRKPSGGSPMP